MSSKTDFLLALLGKAKLPGSRAPETGHHLAVIVSADRDGLPSMNDRILGCPQANLVVDVANSGYESFVNNPWPFNASGQIEYGWAAAPAEISKVIDTKQQRDALSEDEKRRLGNVMSRALGFWKRLLMSAYNIDSEKEFDAKAAEILAADESAFDLDKLVGKTVCVRYVGFQENGPSQAWCAANGRNGKPYNKHFPQTYAVVARDMIGQPVEDTRKRPWENADEGGSGGGSGGTGGSGGNAGGTDGAGSGSSGDALSEWDG